MLPLTICSTPLHFIIADATLPGFPFNFWASMMPCSNIFPWSWTFHIPPAVMLRSRILFSTYRILRFLMLCSKIFSPMLKLFRCYAWNFLVNFPTSLMLRWFFSSMCPTFNRHGWYTMGIIFRFESSLIQCLTISFFINFQSSLVLRSRTKAPCKHCAIIDVTHQFFSNIEPFHHHWCYTWFFPLIVQHHLMLRFILFVKFLPSLILRSASFS